MTINTATSKERKMLQVEFLSIHHTHVDTIWRHQIRQVIKRKRLCTGVISNTMMADTQMIEHLPKERCIDIIIISSCCPYVAHNAYQMKWLGVIKKKIWRTLLLQTLKTLWQSGLFLSSDQVSNCCVSSDSYFPGVCGVRC